MATAQEPNHRGMQLRAVAELTIQNPPSHNEEQPLVEHTLSPLSLLLHMKPILSYHWKSKTHYSSSKTLTLKLSIPDPKVPWPAWLPAPLVHFKLIAYLDPGHEGDSSDSDSETLELEQIPLTSESRIVWTGKSVDEVVSLSTKLSLRKVTVLITEYEVISLPTVGARLCLNQARLDGTLCDVKLVVEGEELDAHRLVLAARSPVFNKMLTGSFEEATEGRIKLVDFSKTALEKFLEFLYTDRVKDWAGSELELLQLAEKYMVPELRDQCELSLFHSDALEALRVLHDAGLCEVLSSQLRRRLTAVVVDNMHELDDTKQWAEFKATYAVLADTMFVAAERMRNSKAAVTLSVWNCD